MRPTSIVTAHFPISIQDSYWVFFLSLNKFQAPGPSNTCLVSRRSLDRNLLVPPPFFSIFNDRFWDSLGSPEVPHMHGGSQRWVRREGMFPRLWPERLPQLTQPKPSACSTAAWWAISTCTSTQDEAVKTSGVSPNAFAWQDKPMRAHRGSAERCYPSSWVRMHFPTYLRWLRNYLIRKGEVGV